MRETGHFMKTIATIIFRVISIVLLLLGTAIVPSFAAEEKPVRIELAENWKLASATESQSDGRAISIAGFGDSRWHPIHRMPAIAGWVEHCLC
jgi:exo-1,4-beta-D-glucosaminidase